MTYWCGQVSPVQCLNFKPVFLFSPPRCNITQPPHNTSKSQVKLHHISKDAPKGTQHNRGWCVANMGSRHRIPFMPEIRPELQRGPSLHEYCPSSRWKSPKHTLYSFTTSFKGEFIVCCCRTSIIWNTGSSYMLTGA